MISSRPLDGSYRTYNDTGNRKGGYGRGKRTGDWNADQNEHRTHAKENQENIHQGNNRVGRGRGRGQTDRGQNHGAKGQGWSGFNDSTGDSKGYHNKLNRFDNQDDSRRKGRPGKRNAIQASNDWDSGEQKTGDWGTNTWDNGNTSTSKNGWQEEDQSQSQTQALESPGWRDEPGNLNKHAGSQKNKNFMKDLSHRSRQVEEERKKFQDDKVKRELQNSEEKDGLKFN